MSEEVTEYIKPDLKPCPFCGAKLIYCPDWTGDDNHQDWEEVQCDKGGGHFCGIIMCTGCGVHFTTADCKDADQEDWPTYEFSAGIVNRRPEGE